jgi:hypothetical protein
LFTQARLTCVGEKTVAVKPVGGRGTAATVITCVVKAIPRALLTLSVTVKFPVVAKVWTGFWRVLFAVPSPKLQDQAVGTPVDISVKVTARGAGPMLTLIAKRATGTAGTAGGGGTTGAAGVVKVTTFEGTELPIRFDAITR